MSWSGVMGGHLESPEVPGLPGVDGPPLDVPLAVADGRPALHPLPGRGVRVSRAPGVARDQVK